ncbi:MAG: hypothetical protein ACKVS5_03575 [Parvularculaceae bacterium]
MTVALAENIWRGVAAYLAIGAIFAALFAAGGAARLDRATKGASAGFRLIIVPGAALLWPLLLVMWIAGAGADRRDAE